LGLNFAKNYKKKQLTKLSGGDKFATIEDSIEK
jgi:hypothetical protein